MKDRPEEEKREFCEFEFSIGAFFSEEVQFCKILCGENPKPVCYGDYPNCRLQYRGLDNE